MRALLLAAGLASTMVLVCSGKLVLKRSPGGHAWHHLARVIGGTNAAQQEYPFAAFIMIEEGDSVAYCGGTIISREWILTAGHCAVSTGGGNSLVVPRNGTANGRSERHGAPRSGSPRAYATVGAGQITVGVGSIYTSQMKALKVSQVHVHKDLNLDYFDNDIALLKLKSKLHYSANVQPIHIDTATVPDGLTVTGIGWGITSLRGQTTSAILQQADMVTGNEGLCSQIRPEFTSNDGDYICVTTPDGRDTCSGDSGGPLLQRCNSNPQLTGSTGSGPWVQLGLTSYGDALSSPADTVCAYPDGAGFYTHVAAYIDFITSTTGISRKDLVANCNGDKLDYAGAAAPQMLAAALRLLAAISTAACVLLTY
ncbi:Transmembrane protease serine 12 [Coemansia nantahalensis]|nr:Transmembrane protease serine 12 [Coemansia nantahalensis]